MEGCFFLNRVFVVKDGDVALVKGYYLYYHYMQDSYDDNVSVVCLRQDSCG